jgi:hypothetical protein
MATRFDLPITTFLETKLRENFPNFNIREGSAYRDMLIKPASLLIQPFRDQLQIVKRNVSISNFALMLDDEFDALVANVFVDRRIGDFATGTVRLFFNTPTDTLIGTDVNVFTEDGRVYRPIEPVAFTGSQMSQNIDGIFFYVDIQVQAVERGSDQDADTNEVNFISGGPLEVVQVTNQTPISAGADRETNTRLFARSRDSISVRDLVTERAINAVVPENFNAIREVLAFGFGDDEMERDLSRVIMERTRIVSAVTGEASVSSAQLTDTTIDFLDREVVPGMIFTIVSGATTTEGQTVGVICRVIDADTIEIADPGSGTFEFDGNFTDIVYTIDSQRPIEPVHTGGKVDINMSTTTLAQKSTDVLIPTDIIGGLDPDLGAAKVRVNRIVQDGQVEIGDNILVTKDFDFIVNQVTIDDSIEILEGPNAGTYEIDSVLDKELALDVTGGFARDENGVRFQIIRSYYEDAIPFDNPVINGVSAALIDPISGDELSQLVFGVDFYLINENPNTRFSPFQDILFQFDLSFVGSTVRIRYLGDETVLSVQNFADAGQERVLTASILAKEAWPAQVDTTLSYRGDVDPAVLEPIIEDFVESSPLGGTIQKSDLTAFLYSFGVTFVTDFVWTARVTNNEDDVTILPDAEELEISRRAQFISRTITLTQLSD